MVYLLKSLLWLPRFIIRLIWNLIWRLIQTAVLLALILWGFWWYINNSTSDFANQLSNVVSGISQIFPTDTTNLRENLQNLSTDFYQNQEGVRWSKPQATIYIQSTDPTLVSAYQTAIANWNSTGAFTFTLTNDEQTADIIARDDMDANTQAAGVAETKLNALTKRIVYADIRLNAYYLLNDTYGYTFERVVNTAEHELGHAIGLSHNDAEVSVMQSSGSNYSIQATDVNSLVELYQS
ncbi:M57 family metalloprotease [Streptococcus sp. sy004]|uniref:M57 family metalloprotease n=1 Tax=Streptococcus sp. sy004 TaxID=2600149 RepID=UPI0011B41A8D|nr:M57 family metalloprotease [Streptococcus sp. sy004]TWT11988.1 matrixin family metalloprotease [Streptococcus sp. sy004]